jgi:CRISPR-associated endonuclease Csn1
MRPHKNDMVALGIGADRQVMRVVKMQNGTVVLAPHNEAGNLKARDADKGDPFKYLAAGARRLVSLRARKAWVDPAGRIRDPGLHI